MSLRPLTAFDKDYKRLLRRHAKMALLDDAMTLLVDEKQLSKDYRLHSLQPTNRVPKRWEIHLGGPNSDWLLIYYYDFEERLIVFERTGSHSDLFK